MKQTQSYTMNLVETMIQAFVDQKIQRGFNRLPNGLFEDCTGQLFTVGLKQNSKAIGEAGVIKSIEIYMNPVNIAGSL